MADDIADGAAQPGSVETVAEVISAVGVTPASIVFSAVAKPEIVALTIDQMLYQAAVRGEGPYSVALPPLARDTQIHDIRLELMVGDTPAIVEQSICSDYVGNLDLADEVFAGWLYDQASPDDPVRFDLEIDGRVISTHEADFERSDVRESGHPARMPGFSIKLPHAGWHEPARVVALRIAGTDYSPFGEFFVGLRPSSYSMDALAATGDARSGARLLRQVVMPNVLGAARRTDSEPVPLGSTRLTAAGFRRNGAPVVDVVIPVYLGYDETIESIASAIRTRRHIPYSITVINDASPDESLTEYLRAWAENGEFLYLENETNLGFVGTVNRGMERNRRADVVLLNSDTVVPPGWLDRMYAAAYKATDIGTVTAFSNNATICSLPEIGGSSILPYNATLEEIDAVVGRVNAGEVADLPTSHGFCMFIKRDVFNEVGYFDHQKFGKGYGEENDFSLRASSFGWRNVIACDVFVQHKGSVSFLGNAATFTETNLKLINASYPDYPEKIERFLQADPLYAARNRVQMAFWKATPVLLVSLAIGGGVEQHVREQAAALEEMGYDILILTQANKRANHRYEVRNWRSGESLLYPDTDAAFEELLADILHISPFFVHIHHVLDLEEGLIELLVSSGIPYQVTLHDFFYICPRVTLLDETNRFCGVPTGDKCNLCIARGGTHPAVHDTMQALAGNVPAWRRKWGGLLRGAARVLAPSESTKGYYEKILPGLNVVVQPHYAELPAELVESVRDRPRIRVAIIGAIGPHKGYEQFVRLASYAERWAEDIVFTVVGFTSDDQALATFGNVRVTGPYKPAEQQAILKRTDADVALFLSPWPETYSYTLSEALRAGLNPVAFDLGAVGERLKRIGCGELFSLSASEQEMVEAIRRAASVRLEPQPLEPDPSASIVPPALLSEGRQQSHDAISLLREPVGLYKDGWARRTASWLVRGDEPIEAIRFKLWISPGLAGQHVTIHENGNAVGRHPLSVDDRREFTVHPRGAATLVKLTMTFDFEVRLSGRDQRSGAAVVTDLRVETASRSELWPSGRAIRAVDNPVPA